MKWFIGVDGGGTKTDFSLADATGQPVAALQLGGCSYQSIGLEATVQLLAQGVRQLLAQVGGSLQQLGGACLGLPCYGENPAADQRLLTDLQAVLAPAPVLLVNDVVVGWAGSLACGPGVHLVAGTGSIAFGCTTNGNTARSGGWNEFFGDEGSCYWVGREALRLFCKQADGRAPKGPLYHILFQALGLESDDQFIPAVLEGIAPHRHKVAALQRYVQQAAEQGDETAAALYRAAAAELAQLVGALQKKMQLPTPVQVAYSGGLFKAGAWVLRPLAAQLEAMGGVLQPPGQTAVQGAVLLAIKQFYKGEPLCF